MHHKNIKAIIKKQLKTNYRDWNRLKKREKMWNCGPGRRGKQ